MTSQNLQWQQRVVTYLAHRVSKAFPEKFTMMDDALLWWKEKRDDVRKSPAKMRHEVNLLRFLTNEAKGYQVNIVPVNKMLNDKPRYYQVNRSKEVDYEDYVSSLISREGAQIFPDWEGQVDLYEEALQSLVGKTRAWRDTMRLVRISARSEVTTLLLGETGTGKSMVARCIHEAGETRHHTFVIIPCGNFTKDNLEREMRRIHMDSGGEELENNSLKGLFSHAGTLYLDKVNMLAPEVQARLVSVLENQQVQDSELTIPRLIASSNIPLERLVSRSVFRRDLYFRLSIFQVDVPPLRSRRDDISRLVDALLPKVAQSNRINIPRVDRRVLDMLVNHHWPGNVQELRNVLERAVLLADRVIRPEHIRFDSLGTQHDPLLPEDFKMLKAIEKIESLGLRASKTLPEILVGYLYGLGNRRFRTIDLAEELDLATSTARAYLAKLTDYGFIKKHGAKKGTTYQVSIEKLFDDDNE